MSDGISDSQRIDNETEAESKLIADMKIVIKHEGEVINITKGGFIDVVKTSVKDMILDETCDEEFPVTVSLYMRGYEYSDNLEAIRTKIVERLNNCDAETLHALLEAIKNEN